MPFVSLFFRGHCIGRPGSRVSSGWKGSPSSLAWAFKEGRAMPEEVLGEVLAYCSIPVIWPGNTSITSSHRGSRKA